MSLPIPVIRERLFELAEELGVPELRELAEATRRRTAKRRASSRSKPMTAYLAQSIRDEVARRPDAHLSTIAAEFGVNPGRVSEAINGMR